MDIVTEEQVSLALKYLAQTDSEHARAKAEVNALGDLTKTVLGFEFESSEGAAEARKAAAYRSQAYQAHVEKKRVAEIAFFEMDNKRKRAALLVDVWRSVNANRRTGNV